MLNKAILIGRLTKDPENTLTTGGNSVTRFTVACDRRYVKKGEERQADFLNCVAFNKTADFVKQYFGKGQAIAVVGEIQTRSWETESGEKRYVTEIIVNEVNFCGGKNESKGNDVLHEETSDMNSVLEFIHGDDDLPF